MLTAVITWFAGSRLGRALSALLSALTILLGVYHYGKRNARSEARTEALEAYQETKERIDEVEPTDDRDANLERLRRRGLVRQSDLRDTSSNSYGTGTPPTE